MEVCAISFSEPVDPDSAADAENYRVAENRVSAVSLQPDQRLAFVLLILLALQAGVLGLWLAIAVVPAYLRYLTMIAEARARGADAIVGLRFATSEIAAGASEFLAYGTAVKLAPEEG